MAYGKTSDKWIIGIEHVRESVSALKCCSLNSLLPSSIVLKLISSQTEFISSPG